MAGLRGDITAESPAESLSAANLQEQPAGLELWTKESMSEIEIIPPRSQPSFLKNGGSFWMMINLTLKNGWFVNLPIKNGDWTSRDLYHVHDSNSWRRCFF